jgi:hypothetical protein
MPSGRYESCYSFGGRGYGAIYSFGGDEKCCATKTLKCGLVNDTHYKDRVNQARLTENRTIVGQVICMFLDLLMFSIGMLMASDPT